MRNYCLKGAATLLMTMAAVSCTHETDFYNPAAIEADAIANAERQLGFEIPEGQNWDMAHLVTANILVNGDYDATYEVIIYQNNPFINHKGTVLGRSSVKSGNTATFSFTCADAITSVFAAIKDAKGYTYVKPVGISNGKIETSFGRSAAMARGTRSMEQSAADNFVIPTYTQPAVAQYLENATEISRLNASGDYAITDATEEEAALIPEADKVQMEGWVKVSSKKLKMTHDWNAAISALGLTDSEQGNYARTLYIENATWTMPDDTYLQVGQGTVIVVGANAEIKIPASAVVKFTGNAYYNCQLIVLPTGKITGEGVLEFSNGSLEGKYDYNAGTIDVGTLNNNGGEFYNAGTVKATVLQGGAGKSTYINAGKFYITRSDYGSGSSNTRILNNCWFDVEENLFARNIVQGPGAYIHVGTNFEMSCGEDGTGEPSYYYAKSNSLLDVEGGAGFNNVDVVGPTAEGEYAYMQINTIEDPYNQMGGTHNLHFATNYSSWENVTVGGFINNIRLSVDNPLVDDNAYSYTAYEKVTQCMLNGGTYLGWPEKGTGNAVLVKKGQFTAAVVEENECTPGIVIVPPTPIENTNPWFTYAFEDNTADSDYDMNDVVLKVRKAIDPATGNDNGKLDILMVAAGAQYNIKVAMGYENDSTFLFGGKEVHDAFGVAKGVMVNTGSATATHKNGVKPVEDQIDAPAAWWNGGECDFTQLKVTIDVLNTNQSYVYPNTREYPVAIMVPADWKWPTERTKITVAYNEQDAEGEIKDKSFETWAKTYPHPDAQKDWYNYPSGSVMNNTTGE